MLNKCIRRYFFPSRAKEAKTQKKKLKNKITPGLRLGDTKKEKVQDSIFDNIFFFFIQMQANPPMNDRSLLL